MAFIASRVLAIYLATDALADMPILASAAFATEIDSEWTSAIVRLGRSALFLLIGVSVWLGAATLARLLSRTVGTTRGVLHDRTAGASRLIVIVGGIVVMLGALSNAVELVAEASMMGARSPGHALWTGLLGLTIQAAAGLFMILRAHLVARRLGDGSHARISQRALELVGRAGAQGIRRAAGLAQSLGSEAGDVARRVMRSSIDVVVAAVEARRPDLGAAAAENGTITIAFSDMEGFTEMTQRLGDVGAHEVIKIHNRLVRQAVRDHRGQEVELQGDGFLLAFPSAAAAVRCADQIHVQLEAHNLSSDSESIRVRIGLNTGALIRDGDRFFGFTVILAARVAGRARGGETLISQSTYLELVESPDFRFGRARRMPLKGIEGKHSVRSVSSLWREKPEAS